MADFIGTPGGESGRRNAYYHDEGDGSHSESSSGHLRAWNTGTLTWDRVQIDNTGTLKTTAGVGGPGGGAVTITDGGDVAQGTTSDVAWVSGAGTVISLLKGIFAKLAGTLGVSVSNFPATQPVSMATNTPDVTDRAARLLGHVSVDSAPTTAVTGTFFPATQPVSATSLTDGTQRGSFKVIDSAGVNAAAVSATGAVKTDSSAATQPVSGTFWQATQPVSGTFWQATQPVSAASLPLPTGAAVATGQSTVKAASTLAVATDTASVVQQSPQRSDASTLWVTAISAANTGVTLTIPSAGAGLFHYITHIEIVNLNPTVTAIAAAATTLSYTTTNLPGSPAWSCGNLLAAGATFTVANFSPATPIKSAVAATATTIVAPAIGTGGLVRMNVTYYTAP